MAYDIIFYQASNNKHEVSDALLVVWAHVLRVWIKEAMLKPIHVSGATTKHWIQVFFTSEYTEMTLNPNNWFAVHASYKSYIIRNALGSVAIFHPWASNKCGY